MRQVVILATVLVVVRLAGCLQDEPQGQETEGLEPGTNQVVPLADVFDGDYYSIKTLKGPKQYEYVWMTTETQRVRLRIKGAKGAHIALAKTPHSITDNTYEVVIGAQTGSKQAIQIKRSVGGPVVKNRTANAWIFQDKFRDFWISWENGVIRVGKGRVYGLQEVINYNDNNPYFVTALSLDTFKNSDLVWQFDREAARDLFIFKTGGNSNSRVWFTQKQRKSFTFGARGKQEAKLGLSDIEGTGGAGKAQTHVIILAWQRNNQKSVIKEQIGDNEETLAYEVLTPDILSQEEMRYFWVSWKSGWIQVGKGLRVGHNMFMNWKPDNPHIIRAVTPFFGSGNDKANPEFHFRNVDENYFLLTSNDPNSTEHFINAEERTVFEFGVRSCSDAFLELERFPEPAKLMPSKLKIILSTSESNGTKSSIRLDPDVPVDFDTGVLLSCNVYRIFWLSWQDSKLQLGTGLWREREVILTYDDPYKPLYVRTLRLGTANKQFPAEWHFDRTGVNATMRTTSDHSHQQAWLSLAESRSIVFSVKAAEYAELFLATYIGNPVVNTYGIVIGDDLNTVSYIWKGEDRGFPEEVKTPGILDKNGFVTLWLSWEPGAIKLGKGRTPGLATLLVFPDDNMYEINALSLAAKTEAAWRFSPPEEPEYVAYTPSSPSKSYETFRIVTHRQVFPFRLFSCDNVYMAFSKVPGDVTKNIIEVAFLSGSDSKTTVQVTVGQTQKNAPAGDILACKAPWRLWVSWYDSKVRVGTGVAPAGIFIEVPFNDPFPVRGVAFSSQGHTEWTFRQDIATEVRRLTSPSYSFDQFWSLNYQRTSQVFRVKAAKDAHILLSPDLGNTIENTYHIGIGSDNNNRVIVWKDEVFMKQTNDFGLVDAAELRTFWLNWAMGDIELGQGRQVGVNRVIYWQDPEPFPVHALSISTVTDVKGTWEFYQMEEEVYHMSTKHSDHVAVMTTGNDYISFTIWGCTPAIVGLLNQFDYTDIGLKAYEVAIGLDNNTHIAIFQSQDVMLKVVEDTIPDLVKCGQAQKFWVGWKNGLIQLGRGQYPQDILLQWEQGTSVVNLFSFASNNGALDVEGQWEIAQASVERLMIQTTHYDFNQFWMTTAGRDRLTFRLTTCGSAHIALTQLAAVTEVTSYEISIAIGTLQDTVSIKADGVEKISKKLTDLSGCKKDKAFWIGWTNGKVELGLGNVFGQSSVVAWTDTDSHEVNFIGMGSSADVVTQWLLEGFQSSMYGLNTRSNTGSRPYYNNFWMVPPRHAKEISFRVKTCEDARMALSAHPDNQYSDTYEVAIGTKTSNGTISTIRNLNKNAIVAEAPIESYVDCNHDRDFWVTWYNRDLLVGRGQTNTFEFLRWHMPIDHFTIRTLSAASGGSAVALWKFHVNEVESLYVNLNTGADDKDRFWVSVAGRSSVVMNIRACAGAQIIMTSVPFSTLDEAYQIDLQNEAGLSTLKDLGTGKVLATSLKDETVLKCQLFKAVWIQWGKDYIHVGRGGQPGRHFVLKGDISNKYPTASIGVGGIGNQRATEWNFLRSEGNVFRTFTGPIFLPGSVWLTLSKQGYVSFRVRGCSAAHVILTSTYGSLFKDTLEFVIGSADNTKVELHYLVDGQVVASNNYPEVLSCTQARRFWIEWQAGTVQLGSGDLFEHTMLSWDFREPGSDTPQPFNVNFLTVASADSVLEWEFDINDPTESCQEDFLLVHSRTEQVATDCYHLTGFGGTNLQDCYVEACRVGGNAINYRDGICNVKRCIDPYNLELTNKYGGWDVYALNPPIVKYTMSTGLTLDYDQHWVTVTGEHAFVFRVMACHDVHLALGAVPGNSGTLAYEVVIGGWGNTQSVIRTEAGIGKLPEVIELTPGILACFEYRTFWVSWEKDMLMVGPGSVVGLDPFLQWAPPTVKAVGSSALHVINAVGLSTAELTPGMWQFGDLSDNGPPPDTDTDEVYLIETHGKEDFTGASWTLAKDYVTFQATAESDAEILLSVVPGDATSFGYKVKLGTAGNTKTTMCPIPDCSSTTVTFDTPNVLNSSMFLPFWLHWTANSLELGQGALLGMHAIGYVVNVKSPSLHSMALATGGDVPGAFEVTKSSGHLFKFMTPDASNVYKTVWITTINENYITFKVKACNDAHILLSSDVDSLQNVYEVALGIGGGTSSVIRKCPQCPNIAWEQTPGIITCDTLRPFWIRWYQGVEVGVGRKVGEAPFLRLHQAVTRPVRVISISTGWGATGEWHFSDIDDDSFYLSIPPDGLYKHIWVYEQTHFFEFQVRSCEGAFILIRETPFSEDMSSPAYEIAIHAEEGVNSTIIRYSQEVGDVKAAIKMPGILSCQAFRRLWVSWSSGDVRVGKGRLMEKTFLYWRDPEPFPVRAIGLSTPKQDERADWQFNKKSGKGTVFFTPKNSSKTENWLTVDGSTQIVFKVQACSDVVLTLASSVGVNYGYQVVLGRDGTSTVLKDPKGIVLNSKDVNPLACDTVLWFWLSWKEGLLSVGSGVDFGYDIILSYITTENNPPLTVGAVGFRTVDTTGMWEFSEIGERMFEVVTPAQSAYEHVWMTTPHSSVTFQLKACSDASVALAAEPGATSLSGTEAYEILLGSQSNSQVEIWKYGQGDDMNSKTRKAMVNSTVDILNCDQFREFWVTWGEFDEKRHIRVGLGPEVYAAQLLEFLDEDEPHPVVGVGFATQGQASGEWVFRDDVARLVRFNTDNQYSIDNINYRVNSLRSFTFTVKAEKDAHIILWKHLHADQAYEFVIGASGNTVTIIRNERLGTPVAYRPTPDILSAAHFRHFWVAWGDKQLSVGYGPSPGVDTIVSWTDSTNIPIQYLSISTWQGVPGVWEYTSYPDYMMIVRTPKDPSEQKISYFLANSQEFLFDVKACAEAEIHLLEAIGEATNYILVLGAEANMKSKVYKRGILVHEQKSEDVLDCSRGKIFWVSWSRGFFEVALGSPLGTRVLEWFDTDALPAHSLVLATGVGYSGEWGVSRALASQIRYEAFSERRYEGLWLTVMGSRSQVMRIRAKSHAQILLTKIVGVSSLTAYDITIGADFNMATSIRETKTNQQLVLKDSPHVLNEFDFRWFWVSWGHYDESEKGKIKVGKGAIAGTAPIAVAEMTVPIDINAMAIGTASDRNATFEFSVDYGNIYFMRMDGIVFEKAWLIPWGSSFQFEVAACQNARLLLTPIPGITSSYNAYEILLGGDDNTGSAILAGAMGTVVLAEASGQGTVDCADFKRYWVKWSSTAIDVGAGPLDTSPFMTYQTHSSQIGDINAIGFAADATLPSFWKVFQEQEKAIFLTTTYNGTYGEHTITVVGYESAVFRVKVCHSARVVLATSAGQRTEIVIGKPDDRTVIIDQNDEKEVASEKTKNILDCDHFKTFWIQWGNNKIRMGKGATVASDHVISYEKAGIDDVLEILIATGPIQTSDNGELKGQWQFFRLRGNTISMHTPSRYLYDDLSILPTNPDNFHLTFRVRTCSDAHVALFPETVTAKEGYEVVFGSYDNTLCEIRREQKTVDSKSFYESLSAKAYRAFWVDWRKGNLTAGFGDHGDLHMLGYYDSNPFNIYRATISTWNMCDGDWEIDQNMGSTLQVHTIGEYTYDKVHLMVMDTHHLYVRIKANHSAHIALSEIPGTFNSRAYEIGLQTGSDSESFIKQGVKSGSILMSSLTPDLLSSTEWKTLWITWTDDVLRVGEGSILGIRQFLYARRPGLPSFTSVAFATSLLNPGDWQIDVKDRSEPETTTTVPTTSPSTTSSTSTTTRRSASTKSSSAQPSESTTSATRPDKPTTPDENLPSGGGLDAGQTVGIVFGVVISLLLLLIVAVVLTLRYKPDAMPARVTAAIPESVQRRVRAADDEDARTHFSNPIFGENALNADPKAKISFGATDDTKLQTFADESQS